MSAAFKTSSFIAQSIHQEAPKSQTKCTPVVAIATFTMIMASTLSQISFKSQGTKYNFKHGIVQTFLMFFGEWINLMIFAGSYIGPTALRKHLIDLKGEAIDNKQSLKFTKLWMALPCLLDCIGSTMSLFSLLLMPVSL
jgi:hypothetical protein